VLPLPPAEKKAPPLIHADLRVFAAWGFYLLLFLAPFMRGLFYAPEQFQTEMFLGVLLVLAGLGLLVRREAMVLDLADLLALVLVGAFLFAFRQQPVNQEMAMRTSLLMAFGVGCYLLASRVLLALPGGVVRALWAVYLAALGVAAVGFLGEAKLMPLPFTVANGMMLSTFQYHNTFGSFVLFGSLLGLTLAARQGDELPQALFRAGLVAGNVLLLLALLASQSRGAWVMGVVAYALFFLLVRGKERAEALTVFLWTAGVVLLLGAPVLGHLAEGDGRTALGLLLGGMVLAVGGYLGHRHHFRRWLRERMVSPEVRGVLGAFAVLYLVAVVLVFVSYESGLPSPTLGNPLSGPVSARAVSIGPSVQSVGVRLAYLQAAIQILLHHPLGVGGGGFNALYHRYQHALFYSTQAHDGFIQMGVDGGAVALLSVLVLVGLMFWNLRRLSFGGMPAALPGGLTAAAGGLVLHAFMDFDLTYGAMLALLWLLIGLARRRLRPWVASRLGPLVLLAAGVLLFWPAYNFYSAGVVGAQGAQAMQQRRYGTALVLYAHAIRRNPYQPTYRADQAEMEAALGRAVGNRTMERDAAGAMQTALSLAPYDISLTMRGVQVYLTDGDWARAVRAARSLVAMDPLEPAGYEELGHTLIVAAAGELRQGRPTQAEKYLQEAQRLPARVAVADRRIDPAVAAAVGAPPSVMVDAQVPLAQAQASYLEQRFPQAKQEFSRILSKHPGGRIEDDTELWLAADEMHLGEKAAAGRQLQVLQRQSPAVAGEFSEVLQLGGLLKGVR
jgi:tetratricopeptide (TPR) repeat protein